MSADYKIATGLFYFCLDKAAVLNDFPCSAFILDRTASVWYNEAYSLFCFLAHLNQIMSCVSSSASNEETIETAEKTITTTSY